MRFSFDFYTTDDSFDYGDFPGGTCYQLGYHGFYIDADNDNRLDLDSLKGYGDFARMEDDISSLEDLKEFIVQHLDEVREIGGFGYTNLDCLDEFIEIIDDNLQKADMTNDEYYDYLADYEIQEYEAKMGF